MSRVSAARPKIADYPFTTLAPSLGVARVDDERTLVVADIPGLIEGAHGGAGLGDRFLRHIERCRLILHLVDPTAEGRSFAQAVDAIDRELALYSPILAEKPQILVLTKKDAVQDAGVTREARREARKRRRTLHVVLGGDRRGSCAASFERRPTRSRASRRKSAGKSFALEPGRRARRLVRSGSSRPSRRSPAKRDGPADSSACSCSLRRSAPQARPRVWHLATIGSRCSTSRRRACAGLERFDVRARPGGVRYTIDTMRALRAAARRSPRSSSAGPMRSPTSPRGASTRPCSPSSTSPRSSVRPTRAIPDTTAGPKSSRRHVAPLPRRAAPRLGTGGRVFAVDMPALAVSSSLVRTRVRLGPDRSMILSRRGSPGIFSGTGCIWRRSPLKSVLKQIVDAASDKKAEDILVLDLRGLCQFTDYFVICHGSSSRQVLAIADAIEERAVRRGAVANRSTSRGRRVADWILLDFIDVVVHVFVDEKRELLRLGALVGDAPRVDFLGTTDVRSRPARRRPSASR